MYEGRTRGKKLKYTYSDEEDIFSDDQPSRRSTRNAGNVPAEAPRTRVTASGRQVRSRAGGLYGEALLTGQREDLEEEDEDDERPQRARTSLNANGYSGYGADDLEDESEARSSGNDSGNEWNSGQEDENDFEGDDEGEDVSGDESLINGEPRSLVVQLRYGKGKASDAPTSYDEKPPPAQDITMTDAGQTAPSTQQPALQLPPQEPTTSNQPQQPPQENHQSTPSTTSPHFSSAPVSQLLNDQDAVPRTAGEYSAPSATLPSFAAPNEASKPSEPANGWPSHPVDIGSRPVTGLPQSQPPPSQG